MTLRTAGVTTEDAAPTPLEPGALILGRLRIEQVLDKTAKWTLLLVDDEERAELAIVAVAKERADLQACLAQVGGKGAEIHRESSLGAFVARIPVEEGIVERFLDQLLAPPPGVGETLRSSSPTPSSRLSQGARFADRYRVGDLLGRGGMGEVYQADDEVLGRPVALKVLRLDGREGTDQDAAKRRLVQEARVVSALKHPNIVEVYDAGEAGGLSYLVLELCAGGNLRKALEEGGASPARRRRWIVDLADALAHAHEHGVIHRDVKPENVVLDENGIAKVADFGIAKALLRDERATVTTGLIGTPRYMAPEQLLGEPVDARSDQYTWALVAYEIWTGKPLQRLGISDRVSRAALEEHGLPRALATVLAVALAGRRAERYESMRAALAQLASLEGGSFVAKKKRRVLAGAAGLLAVAATSFGLAGRRAASPAPEPPKASTVDVAALDRDSVSRCAAAARPSFAAALQLWRDASQWEALPKLEEAVAADPHCASASVLYLEAATHTYPRRHEHYRLARENRGRLSEREVDLLDVLAPTVNDPPDFGAVVQRGEVLLTKRPRDPDVQRLYARALQRVGRYDDAFAFLQGVLASADGAAPGHEFLAALFQVRRRQDDDALARFERCLQLAPDSADCLQWRGLVEASQGRCGEAERDFRRLAAVMPQSTNAYFDLGVVLLTATGDEKAARGAFEARWRNLTPNAFGQSPSPKVARLSDELRMAAVSGDLASAIVHARATLEAVESENHGRFRGEPLLALIELLRETGENDEARSLAVLGLREQRAWTKDEWVDSTIELARSAFLTGGIDDGQFRVLRAEWISQKKRPDDEVWLRAYAGLPRVSADMAVPVREGMLLQDWIAMTPHGYARAASELTRIGRGADAVRHAEAAAHCCFALGPTEQLEARVALADAYAATGATTEACATYELVRKSLSASPSAKSFRYATKQRVALACNEPSNRKSKS